MYLSSNSPNIIGKLPYVILVESDLDAFLINQEAGDLVTAIALGSANIRPDKFTADLLHRSNIILNALDCDIAGIKSFWTWWKSYFPASIRWPVPFGKDPTDAYQQGLCIRDWIIAGLSSSEIPIIGKIQTSLSTETANNIIFDDHKSAIRKLKLLERSGPIIIQGQNYDLRSLSNMYLEHQYPEPIETIKHLTNEIVSKLVDENLSDTAELEFSCLPAVIEMEMIGMHLDSEKWNTLGNELVAIKTRLENTLHAELGEINFDNTKEIHSGPKFYSPLF